MKRLMVMVVILLFVPGMVFARDICSTVGGKCKNYCARDEFEVRGTFVDCERQVCCVGKEELETTEKLPEKSMGKQPSGKVPEKTAPKEGLTGVTGEASAAKTGQVLVCYSTTDTQADKDTPLTCGNTKTTLRTLYEKKYRLIQEIFILSGEK